MSTKIIGRDDGTAGGDVTLGVLYIYKFTAAASGTMNTFKVKCSANDSVKVGLYSDNAGEPDALLNSVDSTAIVSGWNDIVFPDTAITSGTVYWLAVNSNAGKVGFIADAAGVGRYKTYTYATAFPNPAGTGYTNQTGTNLLFAGWGTSGSFLAFL